MRVVCVTGPHRSGTSMVARVLNLLGMDLGPEDDLMEAKPDNPAGFWENLSVARLNDDLFARLGGRWDRPPHLADGWEADPGLDGFRVRAREIVDDLFSGRDLVCWKDPRLSVFLPFWRTVVEVERTVLVVRDPREVAASLLKRNGTHPDRGAYLWCRYVVAAWRNDPHRILVRYREFFEDLDKSVRQLAATLDLAEPDTTAMNEIESFFDPSLRHHTRAEGGRGGGTALAEAIDQVLDLEPESVDILFEAIHRSWLAADAPDELQKLQQQLADHKRRLSRLHDTMEDPGRLLRATGRAAMKRWNRTS